MKRILIVILFLISLFFPNPSYAETEERIIVKFRAPTLKTQRDDFIKSLNTNFESLRIKDAFVLKVLVSKRSEILNIINRNPFVEYSEVDSKAYSLEIPNDSDFGNQWGLTKIQAPEAWNISHGNNQVDIAIVDTGININHPDLGAKITLSLNCTVTGCPAETSTDPDGHGTHVAGIASAITNNSTGVAGLSWDGRLISIKSLDDGGSGFYSWIANGIIAAADAGAEVINLSLGGTSSSPTLQLAVDYAWSKGAVIVGAAGNNGRNRFCIF